MIRVLSGILPIGLLAVLFLAGCGNDPRFDPHTAYLGGGGGGQGSAGSTTDHLEGRPPYDDVSYWEGDGVPGKPHVIIRLGEQRAYFYKGQTLCGISTISTGREGHNTPIGKYHIIRKDQNHVSSRYGDYDDKEGNIIKKEIDRQVDPMPPGGVYDGAKMPYYMEILPGTGMHEGFLPGYPASHGCIRMPGFMAQAFFRNVEVGTPVEITY